MNVKFKLKPIKTNPSGEMKLYGKDDPSFSDMVDFTDKVYIPLDYNSAVPLLLRKPAKSYSICEDSFEKLFAIFKELLTEEDKKRDLLLLMRVKQTKTTTLEKIHKMCQKIYDEFSEDSLVISSAQGYIHGYRFDFYFYDS